MKKTKVAIVGSGFGGVKTGLILAGRKEFDVTLISTQLNFEYHAALYRSATGWSPREVMIPLRDVFFGDSHIDLIQAKISSINPEKKTIKSDLGNEYSYDHLILAMGQVANYYGVEGLDENSFSMDTVANTIALREHLRDMVINGKVKEDYEFIVVGGGATGTELASELQIFIKELCRENRKPVKKVNVTLVEGSARVLSLLSPKASKQTEWRLQELGVKVLLNTQVTGLKKGVLSLGDDGLLKSSTVIWTAGAKNNPFFANNAENFNIAHNTRVEVDEYMAAAKDIYVIGDSANTQYSGMAQTALFDAKFVSKNLIRQANGKKKKLYVGHRPIYAVPVGRRWSIMQWDNIVIWGKPAWIGRRLADLRLFMNFEPYRKAVKTWRSGNKRARGYEIK